MKHSVKNSIPAILISLLLVGLYFLPTGEDTQRGVQQVNTLSSSALSLAPELQTKKSSDDAIQVIAENSTLEVSIASQIDEVAGAYIQQSKYPHYSIPVVDQDLARTPQAFEVTKVSTPTFDERGKVLPYTLTAATDRPSYALGEAMTIQVVVEGAEEMAAIYATARLKPAQGQESSTLQKSFELLNQGNQAFQATLNTAELQISGEAQEFLAVVTANIEGRDHMTSVPFVLSQVSAELTHVDKVEQINDFLLITLDYQVHQSGYYFVKAYLDDAESNTALLSLQAEGKMKLGSGKLVLKAHHQALKDTGSQGPYQLRIIRSFRGAKIGEINDVPTTIGKKRYPIPAFSFDGYADIQFRDPLVEKRINAMKSLASE